MASEIRVDKINSLSGVGTVTLSPTGVDIAGITTAATLRATTGIVTSLTAGSLTSLGAVSGTTGTFSGAVSGTTGTFTGDVDIADKIIHTGDTNTAIRFPAADTVTVETGGSERIRVDSDGHFGIGMSPSGIRLDVTSTVNDVARFAGPNSGNITIRNDTNHELQLHTGTSDALIFGTNGENERLRITSDGNVNIGGDYTQTSRTLAVTGSALFKATEADIWLESTGPNAVWRILGSTGGNTHRFRIYDNTNGKEPFYIEGSSGSNTQHVHVNSGNLVFDANGTGIDFSATSDGSGTMSSEVLDDYEEGTFNPILQNGNNGYRFQYGMYRKVGNAVHFTAFIETSATPPSSNIAIGGLPYTSANNSNANAYVFPMLTNRTSFGTNGGLYARFYMWTNTTYAQLYYPVNSSSSNFETVNANQMNAANASNVWMSGTYFTE